MLPLRSADSPPACSSPRLAPSFEQINLVVPGPDQQLVDGIEEVFRKGEWQARWGAREREAQQKLR